MSQIKGVQRRSVLHFSSCLKELLEKNNSFKDAVKVGVKNVQSSKPSSMSLATPVLIVPVVPKVSDLVRWNADQVEDWFVQSDLDVFILKQLKPCDGLLLNQL
jgi:hypothetical protein